MAKGSEWEAWKGSVERKGREGKGIEIAILGMEGHDLSKGAF